MESKWKVDSTQSTKTIDDVVKEIDKGMQGIGGIKLDPEYQREYKFTVSDESLLIESLLLGIPIPIIYLSSDTTKIPYISNVIDGQHRLRAIYRFVKNQFVLKDLEKIRELNFKKFLELPKDRQATILHQCSLTFENIHVQNNPELEMEIFKRYNTGSHPLSRQEIRHAVYRSEVNDWLNQQIENFYKSVSPFKNIYNITKKRFSDKTAHENIQTMLYILEFGLESKYETSPEYAEEFMRKNTININQKSQIEKLSFLLAEINNFFEKIYNNYNIKYPFSKEIYGVESRNYKVQIPILMIITDFLRRLMEEKVEITSEINMGIILKVISNVMKDSYLENNYKGSSTRPELLIETSNKLYENFKLN
ncbi:DUF262 domain-containing protein [Bacillus zhangzhouensis]|uniref:GmrSD restriction endonucleases N-terminal domain-containing protein n=1 Tax=Bacillus zhangzhouensis TaxID=1178540 RepID=A0A081L7A7_9BACI|nr:DUF262 domain-containing protein [Bacillus zhangzhouensis]KEP25133.1 hypothetical protein BA70_11870 [Bacillus zhangzhouensis]